MNWTKVYENLILSSRNENRSKNGEVYYESHHILPRHMNGSDDPENLVLLTFREHVLAHYLLWRIHKKDQDRIAYKLRSGQKEEAQKLRSKLAVEANRNGGNGFWKKGGENPMKDPQIQRKAIETKLKKYGNAGIYSDLHYQNTIKGMKKPGGLFDPETREKAMETRRANIEKMTDEEKSQKYGRFGEDNGNWGKIKGYYIVTDPDGKEHKYESQQHIIESLNVSQSFLVRKRNKGKIKSSSKNPTFKKWDGWTFNYYKI